jgi:ferredoxin
VRSAAIEFVSGPWGRGGSIEEGHMKVIVDFAKCTGLGICESIAPELFEVNDDGELVLLRADITDDELGFVEEAVAGCPTEALRIER